MIGGGTRAESRARRGMVDNQPERASRPLAVVIAGKSARFRPPCEARPRSSYAPQHPSALRPRENGHPKRPAVGGENPPQIVQDGPCIVCVERSRAADTQ